MFLGISLRRKILAALNAICGPRSSVAIAFDSTAGAAWHKAFNRRLPRNKASHRRAAKARAQRRARRLGQA